MFCSESTPKWCLLLPVVLVPIITRPSLIADGRLAVAILGSVAGLGSVSMALG